MKGSVTIFDAGFPRTAVLFSLMIAGILFMLQSWNAAAAGLAFFPFDPARFGQISWLVVTVASIASLFRRDPGILFSSVGLLYFAMAVVIGPGAMVRAVSAALFCVTARCARHCLVSSSRAIRKVREMGFLRSLKLAGSLRKASRTPVSATAFGIDCLELWERALGSAALAREAIIAARVMGATGLEGADRKVDNLAGSIAESLCREAKIREFLRAEAGRSRVSRSELAVARAAGFRAADTRAVDTRSDIFITAREESCRNLEARAARCRASAVGVIAALDSVRYSATLCGHEGSGSLEALEEEALGSASDLDDEVRCLTGELRLLEVEENFTR